MTCQKLTVKIHGHLLNDHFMVILPYFVQNMEVACNRYLEVGSFGQLDHPVASYNLDIVYLKVPDDNFHRMRDLANLLLVEEYPYSNN